MKNKTVWWFAFLILAGISYFLFWPGFWNLLSGNPVTVSTDYAFGVNLNNTFDLESDSSVGFRGYSLSEDTPQLLDSNDRAVFTGQLFSKGFNDYGLVNLYLFEGALPPGSYHSSANIILALNSSTPFTIIHHRRPMPWAFKLLLSLGLSFSVLTLITTIRRTAGQLKYYPPAKEFS